MIFGQVSEFGWNDLEFYITQYFATMAMCAPTHTWLRRGFAPSISDEVPAEVTDSVWG